MNKDIKLRKLSYNEETQVIDLIAQDEDLRATFSQDRGIRSRLVNSCYTALIEYKNKEIGFVMIVNNPKTNVNEVDMGILKQYRSKGYGTESLRLLKNLLKANSLDVEIQIKKGNTGAINSVMNNGFKLAKEDENHYYYSNIEKGKKRL